MANRLKELSEKEMHFREMTLEGILGIQAGDNPRVIEEKLMSYVSPADRPKEGESSGGGEALKEAA
jgi:chemotaxis protein MotA